MTGAVIRADMENRSIRVLNEQEMTKLMNDYNDLLNNGLPENGGDFSINYPYQEGDCIFIDNMAIAHRASPQAHKDPKTQGLRILHRTTIKSPWDFTVDESLHLPSHLNINGRCPFGEGVWESGGLGFRWDDDIKMSN